MATKLIPLKPILEPPSYFDDLERLINQYFRDEILVPLFEAAELGPPKRIYNAKDKLDDLFEAIKDGRVHYSRGYFRGKFGARITKALKDAGAKWVPKEQAFKLLREDMPPEVFQIVASSEENFSRMVSRINEKLDSIIPADIAEKFEATNMMDQTLWKVEKRFQESVQGIAVAPKLSKEERRRFAKLYVNNLRLPIKEFIESRTKDLRKEIREIVLSGGRRGEVQKKIEAQKGISGRKAKFLARQETSIMMAKYKQARYTASGIHYYKWMNVKGSPMHPVRPNHEAMGARSAKGETFRWDQPPLKAEDGRMKNPGEDYNCRCFAIPVVKFEKMKT